MALFPVGQDFNKGSLRWGKQYFYSFVRQYLENGTRYDQRYYLLLTTNTKLHMRFR